MSLARWSASALHSAANAGSADMDLIRSNENSRSRLLSKSASMRSSTFVSFAASDISDLPSSAGVLFYSMAHEAKPTRIGSRMRPCLPRDVGYAIQGSKPLLRSQGNYFRKPAMHAGRSAAKDKPGRPRPPARSMFRCVLRDEDHRPPDEPARSTGRTAK